MADRALGLGAQHLGRALQAPRLQRRPQRGLDVGLVLARGRDDARPAHDALAVHLVAVPQHPARRLRRPGRRPRARARLGEGPLRRLVATQELRRLGHRVEHLHGAHHHGVVEIRDRQGEAAARERGARDGVQAVVVEVEARDGAREIGLAAEEGVQRGRMRHLALLHVPLEVGERKARAVGAGELALVHRILVRMGERQAAQRLRAARPLEPRGPVHEGLGLGHGVLAARLQGGDGLAARRGVEAAGTHADRMHRAAAEERDEVVSEPLQGEPAAHRLRLAARELDDALAAVEVGRGEEVDVEAVALDPLAAVERAPHAPHPGPGRAAEQGLEGVHGAHLVGDRADAADARHQVRHLLEGASLQEALEEARRLVDAQPQRADAPRRDLDLEGALALDARERRHLDAQLALVSHRPLPGGRSRDARRPARRRARRHGWRAGAGAPPPDRAPAPPAAPPGRRAR